MTSEILPIVAQNVEAVSKPLRTAIGGTLAEFWHGIVGDRTTAWRIKNAAKIGEKLEREVAERGLTLNAEALPESYAFRWFDKASEEDEPELQDLFAKLLANAASGNEAALQRQNIDLISRMTPASAKLFAAITDEILTMKRQIPAFSLREDLLLERYSPSNKIAKIGNDNGFALLVSIGVMKLKTTIEQDRITFDRHEVPIEDIRSLDLNKTLKIKEQLFVTSLGLTLMKALRTSPVEGR